MKKMKHNAAILMFLASMVLVAGGSVHLILLCVGIRVPFVVYVVLAGAVLYAFALTVFVLEPIIDWCHKYRNRKKNDTSDIAMGEKELISMSISVEFAGDIQVEAEVKKQMEVEVRNLTEQLFKQMGELVSKHGNADIKTKTSVKC